MVVQLEQMLTSLRLKDKMSQMLKFVLLCLHLLVLITTVQLVNSQLTKLKSVASLLLVLVCHTAVPMVHSLSVLTLMVYLKVLLTCTSQMLVPVVQSVCLVLVCLTTVQLV